MLNLCDRRACYPLDIRKQKSFILTIVIYVMFSYARISYVVRNILTMIYYLKLLNQKLFFEVMASFQLAQVRFVTM